MPKQPVPQTYSPAVQAAVDRIRAAPTASVPDVATVLGVGRATAYQAVAAGEIPSVRVGRVVRVPSAWVLDRLGIGGAA